VVRLTPENLSKPSAIFDDLEAQGRAALRREFGDGTVTINREVEMRYKGQHHSIKIGLDDADTAARLRTRFDDEYLRRYGHANAAAEVELVVLHSFATMQMRRPDIARLARPRSRKEAPELEIRPIFFLEAERFLPTQIYDRYALQPGVQRQGPAIIVEYGSSTLIGPRDSFSIGKLGEIDIDCSR
jgi:N-methylhydantoinase A